MSAGSRPRHKSIRLCVGITASVAALAGAVAAPAAAGVSTGLISTLTETTSTPTSVTALDGFTLLGLSNRGEFAGALAGPAQDDVTALVRADGSALFSGAGTCVCTVGGTTGPVRFQVFGTQTPSGFRRGHIVFEGTGRLTGLVGTGSFAGSDSLPVTGSLVGPQIDG